MPTTTMIPHQTLTAIVDNVTQARTEVAQAFALLLGAKTRLKAVLGSDNTYYDSLWSSSISDYSLDQTALSVDATVTRNAWKYVIAQVGLRAYMTERRQKELQDQLEQGQFPPLTVDNILATLAGLTAQVGSLLDESAREVFDWLRPSEHSCVGKLKTNHRWRLGEKAIIGYAVEEGWPRGFRLNHYREANFRALGNVFSLLDGHGAQQYPDDLVTQLRTGLREAAAGQWIDTPYVSLKPFKNTNAHLRFPRTDLVDQLNARCGDGSLGAGARQ